MATPAILTPESDNDLFARIKDGVIVDYPVYRRYIKARAHPVSLYTPVIDDPQPPTPDFAYLKPILTIRDGWVQRSWEVVYYTINQLLQRVYSGDPMIPVEDQTVDQVDPALVARVYTLVSDLVIERLTAFAKTRQYDTIDTLISRYRNSTVPQLRTESERGQALLDQSWVSILAYFSELQNGTLPVPRSQAEIEARLPVLTWEDEEQPA